MSPQDQELHLAMLIVRERKAYKKIQCLTSKATQIKDEVLAVMADPWAYDFSQIRTAYPDLLFTDLGKLFDEIET